MNDMRVKAARSAAVRESAKAHLLALRQERLAKRRSATATGTSSPADPEAPVEVTLDDGHDDIAVDDALDSAEAIAHDPMLDAASNAVSGEAALAPDDVVLDPTPDAVPMAVGDSTLAPGPVDDDDAVAVMPEPEAETASLDDDDADIADTDDASPPEDVPEDDPLEPEPEQIAPQEPMPESDEAPADADQMTDPGSGADTLVAEEDPDEPAERSSDLSKLPGIGPGLVWMLTNAGVASLAEMAQADPTALARKLGLVGELLDLDYWIACAADLAEDARNTEEAL
ncbi:MAG: hypothetical protein AAGF88_09180 [Pseudomonadota bacterium]